MNRIYVFTNVVLFCCLLPISVHAQYIHLRGKQFVDKDGKDLYPIVCNYWVHIVTSNPNAITNGSCTCDSNEFSIQPEFNIGSDPAQYEGSFTDGPTRVENDFKAMKSMGFNTVRILGFAFVEHELHNVGNTIPSGHLMCHSLQDPVLHGGWWGTYLSVNTPFSSDATLQNILHPQLRKLFVAAENAGVNIILVMGGGSTAGSSSGAGGTLTQAIVFSDFISAVCPWLKNEKRLLAYDWFNEPQYTAWYEWTHSKKEICDVTTLWYNTLKTVDTNHLSTISIGDFSGVQDFDPAAIHVDFISYHIYPRWYRTAYENYDNQRAMDKMKAHFYWMNHNCPKPWIIGETGASAWTEEGHDQFGQNTNSTAFSYTTVPEFAGRNMSKGPFCWGSFADQTAYVMESQALTLNNSGSGYAWWAFQDMVTALPTAAEGYWDEGNFETIDYDHAIMNPLKIGDPVAGIYPSSMQKPMVEGAFKILPTSAPQPAAMPANYYNAYGGNSATNYVISGTVKDGNGNPIEGAVIHGSSDAGDLPPTELHPDLYTFQSYTFSKPDGTFELIAPIEPYYINPTHNPSIKQKDFIRFNSLWISAIGRNKIDILKSLLPFTDDQSSHLLNLINGYTSLDNLTAPQNYSGSITVTNANSLYSLGYNNKMTLTGQVTNAGNADLFAGNEIDVEPSFFVDSGSEAYIHCKQYFVECADFNQANVTYGTANKKISDITAVNMEVYYQTETSRLSLAPNPASQSVEIINAEKAAKGLLELFDLTGKLVLSQSYERGASVFIGTLIAGIYTVNYTSSSQNKTFKLITNMKTSIKIMLFIAGIFNCTHIAAQWQWAVQGHSTDGMGSTITVDKSGNVYTTGSYNDSIGMLNQFHREYGLFIARHSKDGLLENSYQFFTPRPNTQPFTRRARAFYTNCETDSNIYFLGNDDTSNTIQCFNSTLGLIWKKNISAQANSMALKENKEILLMGGVADFHNTIDTMRFQIDSPLVSEEFILACLDSNRHYKWGEQTHGGRRPVSDMVVKNNRIYIRLTDIACATFDTLHSCYADSSTNYFMGLTIDGILKWNLPSKIGIGPFCVDHSGNVFFTGGILASNAFADDSIRLTPGTSRNGYLAKVDSNRHLVWSRNWPISLNFGGTQILQNDGGDIYIMGILKGTVTMDNFMLTSIQTDPLKYDQFLARFDSAGRCLGAFILPFAEYRDMAIDNSGNIYFTGGLNIGNTKFGGSTLSVTFHQDGDYFVAKYANLTGVDEVMNKKEGALVIYANPNNGSFRIDMPEGISLEEDAVLSIRDHEGKIIYSGKAENAVNLGTVAKGIYAVTLSQQHKKFTGEVVVE